MKKTKKKRFEPVSVIISMRNASTTLLFTLKSIVMQKYPIKEIIIVDNLSKDNSYQLAFQFSKKSKIPIKLIQQKEDRGLSGSFNRGGSLAQTNLIVFLASDVSLPSDGELGKLVEPFQKDPLVVATYSHNTLPLSTWNKYNFWQKYYSCRQVDSTRPGFVVKLDCVRKDIFDKINGFDEKNFGGDSLGGEDADISVRLRKEGKVIHSDALSYHLHYMGKNYGISDIMRSKKAYARSYGRILRENLYKSPTQISVFLVKPALSLLPLIPKLNIIGLLLLIVYSILITKRMFLSIQTLINPRIVLVPFLNILFLYYEDFWIVQAIFSKKK